MTKSDAEKKISKTKNAKALQTKILGRPTKYSEELAQKLVDLTPKLIKEGKPFVSSACLALGIGRTAWYDYKQKYPLFSQAIEYFDLHSVAYIEEMILKGAQGGFGKDYNATSAIAAANNRAGWKKDLQGGTTVNVQNMNILQTKSDSELMEYIRDLKEDLEDVIDVE